MMNNLTKEVISHLFEGLQKGLTLEDIVKQIIKNSEESIDNAFDLSGLVDVQYIINLSKAQEPVSLDEKNMAFENTLKSYELENSFLRSEFFELAEFDKIIYENGKMILAKLDTCLSAILIHLNMIEVYENIISNSERQEVTLVTSKSEKNEELINPKIRTLQKAFALTKSNDVKDSLKIYEEFKKNSLEIDILLGTISSFSDEKIKNPNIININAIKQARTFLECSDISFDKEKIIESLAIYFFSIYKKGSYINGLLSIKKELSRSKVADKANIILSNIFEDNNFSYRHTHVVKPIQHYSYFANFQTPLLEFRTAKNFQEHPFMEKDVEPELLSFFKSK